MWKSSKAERIPECRRVLDGDQGIEESQPVETEVTRTAVR